MASGIYSWINLVNGKIYVGQAVDIEVRQNQHITALRNDTHANYKIQNDFNKYGENNFQFKILEICDRDKLNHLEDYYVNKFNSINNGYNIASTTTIYHQEYQPNEFENKKTKGRKSNGEGCIRKRKDGRWEAIIQIGVLDNGKAKIKYLYAKTESEVQEKLKQYKIDNLIGYSDVSKMTLNVYMDRYLRLYKLNNIKASSYDRLESIFNNHIKDSIGTMLLDEIKTDTIQKLINQKSVDLSYSSLKKIQELLNLCLDHAFIVDDISKNPMIGVKMPLRRSMIIQTKKTVEYTVDETDSIINIINTSFSKNKQIFRYSPIFIFILNTGIRLGEALALTWDKINLQDKTVIINSNLLTVIDRNCKTNNKRKIIISNTKTKDGERVLPLNKAAIEALNEIKRRNELQNVKSKFVVSNLQGGCINPRDCQKTFERITNKANINNKGIHALRHTFGSRLLRNGTDIKVISDILGHSRVELTYDKYIHVIKEQRMKSVQLLDAV